MNFKYKSPNPCHIFLRISFFYNSAKTILLRFLTAIVAALNILKEKMFAQFSSKTCLEYKGSNPCENVGLFTQNGAIQNLQGVWV